MDPKPPKLLDQVRDSLRYKHYSLATEKLYVYWIRFFIRWSGLRHPKDMGVVEVEAFLTMLAIERQVSPSTHRQALSAILYLYRNVLKIDLPWMAAIGRPKEQKRLPVVLTKHEVQQVLIALDSNNSVFGLFAKLLYGTGMRIMEAARLRIKDVDFDYVLILFTPKHPPISSLLLLAFCISQIAGKAVNLGSVADQFLVLLAYAVS